MGARSRKQRRSQPASQSSSLCCAGQRRRHAEHHGRLLLHRSGVRGPRGCAAGLLHLGASGRALGRLPNGDGAGRRDDQRHLGCAAGILHLGAGGRPVGRLADGERAEHAGLPDPDQDVFTNQITLPLVAYRSQRRPAALLSYYTIVQVDGLLTGKLGVTEAALAPCTFRTMEGPTRWSPLVCRSWAPRTFF